MDSLVPKIAVSCHLFLAPTLRTLFESDLEKVLSTRDMAGGQAKTPAPQLLSRLGSRPASRSVSEGL